MEASPNKLSGIIARHSERRLANLTQMRLSELSRSLGKVHFTLNYDLNLNLCILALGCSTFAIS